MSEMSELTCIKCKAKPLARYMAICEDCVLLITIAEGKIKQLKAEKTRLLKLMIEFKDCAHNYYKKGDSMLCPQCIDAINRELKALEVK